MLTEVKFLALHYTSIKYGLNDWVTWMTHGIKIVA